MSTIDLIWSATTRDRAIRRIVIDFYAYMIQPETIENNIEEYHVEFVKDLAIKSLRFAHRSESTEWPPENQKQQPGHYHELDKPHPCNNIHGTAEISLEDEDGVVFRYQDKLSATPQEEYVNAANDDLGRFHTAKVKVQIKHDVWAVVKPEKWSESFGKVSAYDGLLWKHDLTMWTPDCGVKSL